MTGAEIKSQFEQKIDKAYSTYYDDPKLNRLFLEALISIVEDKYRGDDTQKESDELSDLIVTNKIFSLNNNRIYITPLQISGVTNVGLTVTVTSVLPHNLVVGDVVTISEVAGITNVNGTFTVVSTPTNATFTFTATTTPTGTYTTDTGILTYPKMITDYLHLLTLRAKFDDDNVPYVVSGATNASPIAVSTSKRNNFRDGEQVTISGVVGNTNANGTFYVKVYTPKKFALYSDVYLQTAVAGNAAYVSGGQVSKIYYEYSKELVSDRKTSTFSKALPWEPRHEIAEKLIKVRPFDLTCQLIAVDYMRYPTKRIDVTDSVVDLDNYYTEKLQFLFIERAVEIFSTSAKDYNAAQFAQQDMVDNP